MPTPLLNGIDPPLNSFVLTKHKIVWIPVTKAASSSLRWMIADLAGEDFQRFYRASGSHQSRYMTIHTDRRVWQFAPRLTEIEPDELAEISRDNGWFVFTMIRDPWTRLFSAWQSKFLVQHTPYVREYGDQPWFPRVPTAPADVVDDWARFVTARPWETHDVLKRDSHFMTQCTSAYPGAVNYNRVYDITEMAALEVDLHAHLSGLGMDQELYLLRTNENPLPMPVGALDNGIAEIIGDSYAVDVAAWGDHWDLDKIMGRLRPIGIEEVRSVDRLVSANERIGDLSRELKRAQRRVASLKASSSGTPRAKVVAPVPDGTPDAFSELLRAYPWPSSARYPDVAPVGRSHDGFELVSTAAGRYAPRIPCSWRSGPNWAAAPEQCLAIPGSYVVSIDPWKERQAFGQWPALERFAGVRDAALDLFRSFHFEYRARLVAVRELSPRGLVEVHDAGIRPDVVYIDADRRTEAVLRDITVSSALFPDALICGSGWIWRPNQQVTGAAGVGRPVRRAVTQWASFRDHFVEARADTWLIDPHRRFEPREGSRCTAGSTH